jgi:hypothetical protein
MKDPSHTSFHLLLFVGSPFVAAAATIPLATSSHESDDGLGLGGMFRQARLKDGEDDA